jgi:hypothetical protein
VVLAFKVVFVAGTAVVVVFAGFVVFVVVVVVVGFGVVVVVVAGLDILIYFNNYKKIIDSVNFSFFIIYNRSRIE